MLYVMGDVKLAPEFAELVPKSQSSYAVAVPLAADGADGTPIGFAMNGAEPAPDPGWPHAAEFLRWWLASSR